MARAPGCAAHGPGTLNRLALAVKLAGLAAAALAALVALSCTPKQQGIVASGTIEAAEVRISSKVGGEVLGLFVGEGDQVSTGQLLVQIDHASLDLQLQQAQAGVELAEAQLHLLAKGARPEDIQQAQEALTQAQENLRLAREDAERIRQLFASGSATQKQREDAEARYVVAQAQFNSAQQALKKIQNLAQPEEIQAARARLEQARIAVQLLQKNIQDTAVASPLTGLVTHKLVEAGELVSPGTTMLILSDLSRVELQVYVAEPELGAITLGQAVRVRIDGGPQTEFPGRINFISSEAEFTPKNIQTRDERVKLVYRVKVEVDNPQGILKPGMPADALLSP
jgi:HlyD family secretion protein